MSRTIWTSVALLTILALGCAGPVAPEQAQQEWDQAAVTALAQELVQVAGDLRDSARRLPDAHPIGVRRSRHRALDALRVAQGSVRSLARQLEGGAGRAETYPTFRRIQVLRRDIARNAQRSMLREPTLSKLGQTRAVLEKLEPFYAAEAEAYEDEYAD
jgi:hypothetical protein